MKNKHEKVIPYLCRLMRQNEWEEINAYIGADVRGVMFEMQEFGEKFNPSEAIVHERVARCLLILKGVRSYQGDS